MADGTEHSNNRQRHMRETFYSCAECKKQFSSMTRLTNHMNIHSDKYKCIECDRYFDSYYHLAIHWRCHSGEKPFECNVCSKQFTTKHGLSRHKTVHNVAKPYKCHLCDKHFSYRHCLSNHMRVHAGKKLYDCSKRNKGFRHSSNLQKHQSFVKFKRRRYKCPYCRKRFESMMKWTCHVRVHTGEKPCKCKRCSECFAWPGQLRQHMLKSHSGGTSPVCRICQKKISGICNFMVTSIHK